MWIIAHRGASAEFPENTMAAFDAALEQGADGIELDLQLSADGVPVVFHDSRMTRLGRPRHRINRYSLEQLREMDAGAGFTPAHAGARMPTLDEVLRTYAARTRLYLEIKHAEGPRGQARHRELAYAVAQRIRDWDGVDISVLSFHNGALETVRALVPDAACVRNLAYPLSLRSLRRQAGGLAGISIDIDRFDERHAAALAEFHKPLFAYTCDSRAALRRAVALGVTHIITNRPARSRQWLAEQARA